MGQRKITSWVCEHCGAHLGMIRYSGSRVPLLELYRHAVDMKAQTPHEVDVIGLMRGRLPVRCDICRGITVWHEKRR